MNIIKTFQMNLILSFELILILLFSAQSLFAAPGDLDQTFGAGGKVLTNIGAGAATGRGMIIQPDGKIVVAGATSLNDPASDFLVVRYNTDGTLDSTFDGDGKLTTDFNNRSDAAFGVAMQLDGRIVVVGVTGTNNSNKDFAIARYNSDGSLDSTFDVDGRAVTDFGNLSDEAFSVAIAPTGKIVVAGTTSSRNGDFAVARYLANGSLDSAFDSDGLVTTDAFCIGNCSNTVDRGRGVAVYPDGRIVVAGDARTTVSGASVNFAVALYLDTGAPDFTFGFSSGKTIANAGGCCSLAMATAMALQPDGKIVVVGGSSQFGNEQMNGLAAVRFNANGFLDFQNNNLSLGNAAFNYHLNSVAIQPDGKIVAAGNFNSRFLVSRYLANGANDVFFGNNGVILSEMNPAASSGGAFAVGVQADGKIVAAGHQQGAAGGQIAVARHLVDGCAYAFSRTEIVFPRIGGNQTLTVMTQPTGCQWTAVSGADWLTIISGGSGSENGTVTIRAALNNTTQARSTTLTIGGKVINIFQDPGIGVPRRVRFDFDNDGRADFSVARLLNDSNERLAFYTQNSAIGFRQFFFSGVRNSTNQGNFKIVPADYDGDGTMNYAVWKSDNLTPPFFDIFDEFGSRTIQFGLPGDVPLPSDWDGDGRADLAVYRGGTAGNPQSHFYYRPTNTAGVNFVAVPWGTFGDKPVIGDFDGDGKTDAAVFRPSNRVWYVLRSSDGVLFAVQFGLATDKLVPADYDGDSKTDLAVYRDGIWYIQQSRDGFRAASFGVASDTPVPADYDGDGRTDIAVFRSGIWYLLQSTNGFAGFQWGANGDTPVEAAYLQ